MASTNDYTPLIAGYHSGKEKYTQWVYELTQPLQEAREKIANFASDYDVDLAVGNQLDAIGVRVGISRKLRLKITDVFFAFDDVDGKGFDFGIWKTPRDSQTGITELGDEIYRMAIKAKIALNHYSGNNEGIAKLIQKIADAFEVNSSQFSYVDNQDMSVSLYIRRAGTPPIVWQLFYNRVFNIAHAGIDFHLIDGVYGVLATTDATAMTKRDGTYLMMDY